ncbi:MAG: VWA domain-containing protein [Anaerolineales bacterium]|nr:VWA domain-containing protein [Anaerolineales bacterium]
MSFLTPLALALGALALPILVLYMLKLRRREVEIPSVMLWQLLLRDREANAPWQRLKRSLLLLLQLLLLVLVVAALARPFLRVPAVARGTVIVLLDASASMNAADGGAGQTRFEAARAAVRQIVDGLAGDSRLTLIQVGRQPQVLASATADQPALRAALAQARVSQGPADWEAAFALAAGAARAGRLDQATIVIVSDGGLPAAGLPPLPGDVRYVPIGTEAENLALAALSVRAAAGGPELFARVANAGVTERAVILSIERAGALYGAQQLTVPAGGSADLTLTALPDGPAVYTARLTAPGAEPDAALDALPLDDVAWAVYQPPASGRALLRSPGNVFLEQILTALPGLQPFRLLPGAEPPAETFDLYVLDSVTETVAPADGALLWVNPISSALFTVGAVFTNTELLRVAQDDPLTRYLDWSGVHVLQARQVTAPAWARVVVEAAGGPLVFAGETGGRRVAVLTFRLQDSDLPLQLAYPVLMSNLINYLAPAQAFSAPDGLRPGGSLTIRPRGGESAIAIIAPDGTRFQAAATEAGVLFTNSDQLGLYSVVSDQAQVGVFAVNLFDPAESALRPAAAIRVGRADVSAAPQAEVGQLEIWRWVAAAAFVILLLEWWVYQRGATLPALPGWRGFFRRKKITP